MKESPRYPGRWSHRWYRSEVLYRPKWDRFQTTNRYLRESLPADLLYGPTGSGEPVFTDLLVTFNGDGAFAHDGDPFILPRVYVPAPGRRPHSSGKWFNYCQTYGLPYDLLVQLVLLNLRTIFASVVFVHSDRGPDDWAWAVGHYARVLGTKPLLDGPWAPGRVPGLFASFAHATGN